ncbi:MAG: PAS domain S-box protein [Nitrospira sp.]
MPSKDTRNNQPRRRVRSRNTRRSSQSGEAHGKEDFFATAFRLSPHPIGITELETGRCLEINDACLQLYGFQRQEVIGNTTLMLGIWPDPQERDKLIARIQAERSVRSLDVTMRTKKGDLRHFLISTDVIVLKGKRCLLTVGTDVTERKQAEEALRESRQQLRAIVEGTSDAVFIKDVKGRYLLFNAAAGGFVGKNPDEVLGHDDTFIFPPDDATALMEADRHVMAGGRTVTEEDHLTTAGQEKRTFLATRGPLLDAHGRVSGLFGIARDITDRKRAEEALRQLNATLEQQMAERTTALRESEERFRTFLGNAVNLAFIKSKDGRYLYVNRRFEEAFQLEQKQIVGKTDEELFGGTQADQFQANDRCVLESGRAVEFEETARYADGLHTNIVVKFPLRDGVGQIYGMGGIVTDITYRKQAEEKLRQQRAKLEDLTTKLLTAQERERQRIARDLHDDVTQRLASLSVEAGALEQLCRSKPALLPHCLSIREAAQQLADDVHNFAYRLHPSSLIHIGLAAAIRDHVDEVVQRTGMNVEYVSHKVPNGIPTDTATCLYRVTQESLQNVLKHADASTVSVRLLGTFHGVGVCIYDNGKGFEHEGASARGLGLLSMEERVRVMNGTFRTRTGPGSGTEVHAWVPYHELSRESTL